MADSRSHRDLNYGQFGQPDYNVENKIWRFPREPGHAYAFRPVGAWQEISDASHESRFRPAISQPKTPRHAQNEVQRIIDREPDIAPVADLLSGLESTSSAIVNAASVCDPLIGDQLSVGSFTHKSRYRRPRRIIAMTAGECNSILRLVVPSKERQGWIPNKKSWVEGPSLRAHIHGYWAEIAAPIQQVCFAGGDQRSAFLAVRYPMQTVVFRPISHSAAESARPSHLYELPVSTVDPCYLFSISREETGGSAHVDIAFNPEYQRQLGIVDIEGRWGIWDIEGGEYHTPEYYLSRGAFGTIVPHQVEEDDDSTGVEDGWARMLWIGDVNTVLVCNRRRLCVFDIGGGKATELKCATPVSPQSSEWILDIRAQPTNRHRFFVLTTTRLYLMAVTCQNDRLDDEDDEPGASVLLTWVHYRAEDDITLQMYIPPLAEDDVPIFLSSRTNNLITMHQFRDDETGLSGLESSIDPTPLMVDVSFKDADVSRSLVSLHLDKLDYHFEGHHQSDQKASAYHEQGVYFYRLSVVFSDGSIHQLLLYRDGPRQTRTDQEVALISPSWSTRLALAKSETAIDKEQDFIEGDGVSFDKPPGLVLPLRKFSPASHRKAGTTRGSGSKGTMVSDYRRMYDALISNDNTITMTGSSSNTDAFELVDQIEHLLAQDKEQDWIPRVLLFDLSPATIDVPDVDAISTRLQDLCVNDRKQQQSSATSQLRRLAEPQALHLDITINDVSTISTLYDSILETWIATLPDSISNRVRQVKERLARGIATQVALASLYPAPPLAGPSAAELPASSLPVEDPTPFPRAPSSQISFSQQKTPDSLEPLNKITSLSRYLNISQPLQELPPRISQTLMHWEQGTSPAAYDWQVTSQVIDSQFNVDEEDDPSQRQRQRQQEKLKRRAERLLKRQRRDKESQDAHGKMESQPLFGRDVEGLRSSPAPVVGMSSQPQTQIRTSSQVQGSQNFGVSFGGAFDLPAVQSQVEPGRHGGRPVLQKKRKKRQSGF